MNNPRGGLLAGIGFALAAGGVATIWSLAGSERVCTSVLGTFAPTICAHVRIINDLAWLAIVGGLALFITGLVLAASWPVPGLAPGWYEVSPRKPYRWWDGERWVMWATQHPGAERAPAPARPRSRRR